MKISIRWALILGFLGLIWGTQIIITTSTYLSSQRVLLQHARDIMQNIADLTMEQSENHLALAQSAAHLTKRLIASKVVGSQQDREDQLERYFLDQLAIYPHFAGIYVGMPNGDFFYVSRAGARQPNGFRTKIIRHVDGRRHTELIWRDKERKLQARESDPQDQYDPRQRPWYQKAMAEKAIVWTAPYIFFTSQKPGITIAGPIYQSQGQLDGIVGVDIEIDQLSIFISKLRIGKSGRAFMLNNNGDVVAFPDLERIRIKDGRQAGKVRLVQIEELDDSLSRAAFQAMAWPRDSNGLLQLKSPRFARFVHNGQAYHTMFTPFKNARWPWIIGVYVPESDYLGKIQANRRFNFLMTMALSVLATLIGLWLARGIIRPLAGLEKEALAIKQHDLNQQFDTRSGYKEIQETADSFARMKEAMRTSEEKYRAIFENIQDVYYEASVEGRILEISPSIARVSSYTRSELIGSSLNQLYKDAGDREKLLAAITATGKVTDYELTLTNKDGSIDYCSINASLKRDAGGRPDRIIGSLRVITDRKKADLELRRYRDHLEELVQERMQDLKKINHQLRLEIETRKEKEAELRNSEEKYRSIIKNMDNGYYEVDLEGNLTFFNVPLAEILGYPHDQLYGLNFREFMDPDTAQSVANRFATIRRTGIPEKISRYRIIRRDGRRKTLEASAACIMDHEGRAVGFRGVVLDITERLNAEKEKKKLEARFQQIQRLEGIGTLAGGVAHDFNNLLMGIQGNVSLLLLDAEPGSAYYEKLKSIEGCITGGADLTRQLLGFARGGKYIVKPLDFNQIIHNTSGMFGRTRKEISIITKMELNLWTVMADQSQIEQVLLNIYINAWQAMPEGGNIYVETKNVVLDQEFVRPFDISPGRYVRISVADTGTGMDEATQQHIFEPFFTTKEIGRGTGLGLASAFGIIKNHDGAIDFQSQAGEGTTFYIYLPATDKKIAETPAKEAHTSKGQGTILLVDDERIILQVNQPMLEELGYTVLTAADGRTAIDVFIQHKEHIDMVVLDMIMPDLGGGAVFDRLKAIKPDVKVLLSSGYSLAGQAEEIMARGCAGFIQKPFNIEQLSIKILQIMESDPGNR